jgi:anaerobic ribonucleoside-triphosphate reductase activating protein
MPAKPKLWPSLQINKAHYPVTVLGPGNRIGIWLQGCKIHCKNCVSQDTWKPDPKREMGIPDIIDWCRKVAVDGLDGITISGGEPFDQPIGLFSLLAALGQWRRESKIDLDILCYSGYPLRTLESKHGKILAMLDAVIPEPYIDSAPPTAIWCGSANQHIVPLTALGREKYTPYLKMPVEEHGKQMQVSVDKNQIWMIGIPARGDMEQLEVLCQSRGISMKRVSWRR